MREHILAQILFEHCLRDETIYNFEALLENRLEFIKKSFNNKYDPLVDHIAQNIDPTDNKKYTQWLMRRHVAGDSIPSAKTLKTALTWYDKSAPKSHVNDINQHTVQSMMDVAHMTRFSPKYTQEGASGIEEIYSNNGVKAYKVHDKQTMINIYGGGRKHTSRWCTAADGHDNMFDRYDGGKYTIHYPNGEYMHLHHQSGQAKDPTNTEIDFSSDKRYTPYNEDTRKVMEKTAEMEGTDKELPERHFGISDEEFHQAWKGHRAHDPQLSNKFLRNAEIKPLSDEQYSHMMNAGYLRKLSRNPNLSDSQVSHFLEQKDWEYTNITRNPSVRGENLDHVFNTVINNRDLVHLIPGIKNLQPHHVDELLEKAKLSRVHSDTVHDLINAGTYKFTDKQVDHIHDHEGAAHALNIAMHQPVQEHVRQSVVDRIKSNVVNGFGSGNDIKNFAQHNELRDDELHDLIGRTSRASSGQQYLSKILDLPNLKREHVDHIVHELKSEKYGYYGHNILTKPALAHSDVESLLVDNPHHDHTSFSELHDYLSRRDSKATLAYKLAKQSGLTPHEDLSQMGYYKKKDIPIEQFSDVEHAPHILKNLQYHPKATYKDINNLLDAKAFTRYPPSSEMINNVLNHPNAGPENVHKILDHWGSDRMIADQVFDHERTPQSAMTKLDKMHPGRYTPE